MKILDYTQPTEDEENEKWRQFVESSMLLGKEEQRIDIHIRYFEGISY